jgi:hypothetical protein
LDIYDEQYTFDLADFIGKAFPDADKSAFFAQLNRTVLYKNATPEFLSGYKITAYCGLSCYIPHPLRADLNEYYETMSWYAACGINLAKLYDASGDKSRAQELAKVVLNKRIKIPSPAIAAIQEEMRQLIEQEKSDSATQGRTDVEPLTTQSWQDTVSERSSPETLLPP